MATPALDNAQATILGRVLAEPAMAAKVFSTVRIEDFDGQYRLIGEAIHGLRVAQAEVSPLSVIDEMTRRGSLSRAGGAAEVIRVSGFDFGSVDYAIDVMARFARLRRLWKLAAQTTQRAEDSDADPYTLARQLQDEAQAILDGIEAEGDVLTPTIGEFLNTEDAPYDWVIEGLLERGDRLVLTGSEGVGKSVCFRQLAICAAAGVHPFSHKLIPPQRVLYIDCENGPVKLRRAFRPLAQQAKRHGSDPSSQMFIETRPEGLDLTRPEDEAWFVRTVAALQPAILLTGPLYRLHAANPNDEQPARTVARVLDRARAAANCALVVEAHAGHGVGGVERPVRPTGTSLWLRWPEFGYGLRATKDYQPNAREVDLVGWRGDREERDWPSRLRSGGTWPWQAVNTDQGPGWGTSYGRTA